MIWPDERHGGLGDDDFRYEQIIIEETARAGCGEFYNTLHSRLVGPYFRRFATPEQQDRFLPKCVTGEHILAIAMTEPGAGSDLAGMKTRAEDKGDHFLLNGQKTYISNGINADIVIVAARLAGAEKPPRAGAAGGRARHGGVRARPEPQEDGARRPGHGRAVLRRRARPQGKRAGRAWPRLLLSDGGPGRRAPDRRLRLQCRGQGTPSTSPATMSRSARPSASRSPSSRTPSSRWPSWIPRSTWSRPISTCAWPSTIRGRLTAEMGAKAKLASSEVEGRMVDLGVQLHGGAGYIGGIRDLPHVP